jgi:hypothetical protein
VDTFSSKVLDGFIGEAVKNEIAEYKNPTARPDQLSERVPE